MANLNYQKYLKYCKKQIDQNPFVVKAIFIHIVIVVVLYILSIISISRFESSQNTLHAQVSNLPKKIQVIQATSISSSNLNKQISAYENHQQELKQTQQDVKEAKERAFIKHKQIMKQKAKAAREAEIAAKKKADLEEKRIEQAKERKAEQEKQAKLEQQKAAKEEVKRKLEAEQKAKEKAKEKAKKEAEQKARRERLAKAKAEAEVAARKQIEQNQAQSAISSYISEYQDRVGANWIKDSCRGIYDLPRAIIRDGQFIKLTGTSGNYRCDQALIDAIKNTTPPVISNNVAKRTIQTENVSFIFKQS